MHKETNRTTIAKQGYMKAAMESTYLEVEARGDSPLRKVWKRELKSRIAQNHGSKQCDVNVCEREGGNLVRCKREVKAIT